MGFGAFHFLDPKEWNRCLSSFFPLKNASKPTISHWLSRFWTSISCTLHFTCLQYASMWDSTCVKNVCNNISNNNRKWYQLQWSRSSLSTHLESLEAHRWRNALSTRRKMPCPWITSCISNKRNKNVTNNLTIGINPVGLQPPDFGMNGSWDGVVGSPGIWDANTFQSGDF